MNGPGKDANTRGPRVSAPRRGGSLRVALRRVEISTEGLRRPAWLPRLVRFCGRALRDAGYARWDLSILLCRDERMAELNARYRGLKGPTDVLSFPREDPPSAEPVVGDLAISMETLRRNAAAFGCTEEEELKRLTVHGLLHLAGMDHGRGRGGDMLALQERLLEGLRRERILGERKK